MLRGSWFPVACGLILLFPHDAMADGKEGMPDLCQVDNTCLPTSTAQLLIWFSRNGYPQLLPSGATKDERNLALVHRLMTDTSARFDWGTDLDRATGGITNYVHSVGYGCNVEFRGLSGKTFTSDWLNENNQPDSGFVLILQYVQYNKDDTFSNVLNMGHAVTLVSYDPEAMIIEDTAHEDSEPGKKLITPTILTHGTMMLGPGQNTSVSGLMLLSGSLLLAPPHSMVMVIGAIRIKMFPNLAAENSSFPPSPAITVAGGADAGTPTSPSAKPVAKSWMDWFFDWLMGS